MLERLYYTVILALVILVFSSCVKEGSELRSARVRVLFVYVGTDNNLSGYEQVKLQGLRDGWSGADTDHILAYIDDRSGDARLIEISNLSAGESPRRIASYGSGGSGASGLDNSASPATLSRVISDVRGLYPADSYGLLVFSHASGWLPGGSYNEFSAGRVPESAVTISESEANFRSVILAGRCVEAGLAGNESQTRTSQGGAPRSTIMDGTYEIGRCVEAGHYHDMEIAVTGSPAASVGRTGLTGNCQQAQASQPGSRSVIIDGADEMELADFAAAIPEGVFDYIVFEACFMAGIEVAYELRAKAPYLLASSAEIVDPGFSPVYSSATGNLMSGNLRSFGQSVFDHVLTYSASNPQRSATYSVIRTAGLDALASFVRSNCDLTEEVDIAAVQRFDRLSVATLFFDFGDYYGRLLDTDEQRSELARLIGDCVIWKAATATFMTQQAGYNGFTIENHSGLTAYIPQGRFPGLNCSYGKLGWARSVGFDEAL